MGLGEMFLPEVGEKPGLLVEPGGFCGSPPPSSSPLPPPAGQNGGFYLVS